jgi:hypothetical protein
MLSDTWVGIHILGRVCGYIPWICNEVVGLLMNKNPELDNRERVDFFVSKVPNGTSLKNLYHLK